jgi:hypothetical protein
MTWYYRREPSPEEMLSDPIVRAMMDADGVDALELEAMLKEVGRNLGALRSAGFHPHGWPRGAVRSDRGHYRAMASW